MTGHKLCSPGEFKDPRVFVESQDEYTKAQLSLSYEFSDQNISTMLRDYDIKGLCAATRSVTGDYLTEEEQSHFFHLLSFFSPTVILIRLIVPTTRNRYSTKRMTLRYSAV